MDRLPDEVILHLLSFLAISDIVRFQAISSRYLALARDDALWKIECFDHSRAEALRIRQALLDAQDSRLAELRNAVSALPGPDLTALDVAQLKGSRHVQASSDPEAEERRQRTRALANWEPGYPGEPIDYYEEFIARHAEINVDWITLPKGPATDKDVSREATGVSTLIGVDGSQHVVAPLDDGSVCIWDIAARSTSARGGGGRSMATSASGLLTGQSDISGSHTLMTETGAVECVSVDNQSQRAYFAVQNQLKEVDLQTMQLTSTKEYPFPITALSSYQPDTPLIVGTNMTIHLHDSRDSPRTLSGMGSKDSGELIGGTASSHATLSQPGPLSILNHRPSTSIWVAGRFTSLLNYDLRHFPRLLSTVHSGARIASLTSLPYPLIPRSLDLIRNPRTSLSALHAARSEPGTTLLAAAEYKGKGSLELYGLPSRHVYQNRQTASASKLLSAAPHGGRMVFADGDGNLKWMERDGFTHVRTYNINSALPSSNLAVGTGSDGGIFSSSASEMPGQGDIVQKLIPLPTPTASTSGRFDDAANPLLLWTGDGRLGILGFGSQARGHEDWHDAVEEQGVSVEERAREDAERQFAARMRRALERNADEVRFVRGLGLAG